MKTRKIADFLSAELTGDGDIEIIGVAALDSASKGELAYLNRSDSFSSSASCIIVPLDFAGETSAPVIRVKDPKLAFSLVAKIIHPPKLRSGEIHPTAIIAKSAVIGADVFIGAFVCIGENSTVGNGVQLRAGAKLGDNVRIGPGSILDPNAFVEDNCTIGANVILHSGAVIGSDGFGFVRGEDDYVKFPQIGTVVIEDNVEIGANSCIDRGALGETRIGEGTKIDNLIQIAHNVQIGKRVIIAAQTGISGSTIVEDDCVIGGQVGFGDHVRVLSGAVIGSQAGVLPGKIVRPGVWWGTPIQPLDEYKRQNAHIKGIARLKEEVRELKKQIAVSTSKKSD